MSSDHFGLVWLGFAWFRLVSLGFAWFGLVWFGLAWFGLARGWFGAGSGRAQMGLDASGCVENANLKSYEFYTEYAPIFFYRGEIYTSR